MLVEDIILINGYSYYLFVFLLLNTNTTSADAYDSIRILEIKK